MTDQKMLTKLFILFNGLTISGIALFSPILYIFLIQMGYSYTEVGIYLSVFWGTSAICELPAGILADTIGQKKIVVYSCLIRALGLLLMTTNNFVLLISSSLFTGIAEAMLSGSLSSWYMNQLVDKNNVKLDNVFSKASFFSACSSLVIGFISAQYLFKINTFSPIILSVCFFIALSYITYKYLPEKNRSVERKINNSVKKIEFQWFNNFKALFEIFYSNKLLIFILLILVIPSILDIGPSNQWQIVFSDQLGYMWIAISLIGILTNLIIPKLPRLGDGIKEIVIYILIDMLILFLVTYTNWSLIFFIIHIMIFTITSVRLTVFMHQKLINSDHLRSSFISTFYTVEAFATMMLLPLNGFTTQIYDVFYAWNIFILISAFLLFFCIIIIFKNRKSNIFD